MYAVLNFLINVAHGLSGSTDVLTFVWDSPFHGDANVTADV